MAVIFGVGLIPILGAVGLAVDYSRALNAKNLIQAEGDALALSAVQLGSDGNYDHLVQHFSRGHGASAGAMATGSTPSRSTRAGSNAVDFQVDVRARGPDHDPRRLAGIWRRGGCRDGVDRAISRSRNGSTPSRRSPTSTQKPPTTTASMSTASTRTRRTIRRPGAARRCARWPTNAGTSYPQFTIAAMRGRRRAELQAGERAQCAPPAASLGPPDRRRTLPVFIPIRSSGRGLPDYDLGGFQILETVLCNTLAECRPVSQGGIIPEGKERIQQRASKPCETGKYMYYGWEDRPAGLGWTDRDYDDIRVIVECPSMEQVGQRSVRLIR